MIRAFLLAVAAFVLLSACVGSKTYNPNLGADYRYTELMAAHGGKDMKLEVIGDPYGVGAEALTAELARAMNGRNLGLPITFAVAPSLSPDASTRMVAAFDPRFGTLDRQVCAGRLPGKGEISHGTVILAYCRDDNPLSSMWVDLPPQKNGPALAGAFNSALIEMLPRTDRGARDGGSCDFCF